MKMQVLAAAIIVGMVAPSECVSRSEGVGDDVVRFGPNLKRSVLNQRKDIPPPLLKKSGNFVHVPLRTIRQNVLQMPLETEGIFGTPVSIHQIRPGAFLVSDYKNAFIFRSGPGVLSKLHVVISGLETEFVPTQFASSSDGRIFIANYHGNNVLEAQLDIDNNKLIISKQIRDDKTISPEGVDFSESHLAVANYDGNNVQVFVEDEQVWRKFCDLPVPQAHGVAFVDGHIFASSLQERKIFKIDYKSCSIVSEIGAMGWGGLMWPTGVSRFDDRSILVSDAHTGLLSVFDTTDMKLKRTYGGNGPGKNGLNMPYTAIRVYDDIWITSTFGRRLFRVNADSGYSETYDISKKNQWNYDVPESSFLNRQRFRSGYRSYVRLDGDLDVSGNCYRPSYRKVLSCDGEGDVGFPEIPYFIQLSKHGNKFVLSSPQSSSAYVFYDPLGKFLPVEIGFDHWVIYGTLHGPRGAIDLNAGQ